MHSQNYQQKSLKHFSLKNCYEKFDQVIYKISAGLCIHRNYQQSVITHNKQKRAHI